MLIVADGADVRDLLPVNDDRIRLIHVAESRLIGEKRNFGCERAGEVVCHWDDDDYSSPERLATQVLRLDSQGKAVTGFHSMRFADGEKWWRYEGRPNYALGTSLCYWRDWWKANPFPALQVGEDNQFVFAAAAAKQLDSTDAGELMYATIHPNNTSPRNMGAQWKPL